MSKDYSAGKYGWNDIGGMESSLVAFERDALDPYIFSYVTGYTLNDGCGPDRRGDVRLDIEETEATTIVGNACELPFPDNYFDTVMLIGVLHHISKYEKAITEACRVSRNLVVGREPNILNPQVCTVRHFLGFEGECPVYIPKVKRTFERQNFSLYNERYDYGLKLIGTVLKKHSTFYRYDHFIPKELRAFWSYVYVRRNSL